MIRKMILVHSLKAIGIVNAVKEQINQNKENQHVLAQASMDANE